MLTLEAAPLLAQNAFEFKLTYCTRNDPNHESMKLMKAALDRQSNGRLNAQLYPGCQLGTTQRSLEGAQLGTIELHSTPPGFAVGLNPNFQVADAPGLLDGIAHAARAYRHPKFRDKFADLVKDKGLSIIALWPHSPSNYASVRPIRTLDDFKGKKIRVLATKTETALMASVGASGVPIDFAELLPALQRRTIDGVRSSLVVMTPMKYYDVAKYATVVNDSIIPIAAFVSRAFLNKVPRDLRDLVIQVGRDVEAKMPPISEDFGNRVEKSWQANGGEIIRLPEKDHAEFLRRAKAVAEDTLASNPATREMYALFKEAADATR